MDGDKNPGWNAVRLARREDRPRFRDYLEGLIKKPMELHGDRCFGDDPVIWTGWGIIGRERFMIVGQSKGGVYVPRVDTREESLEVSRVMAGCPNPEGYRKVLEKMKLAEKYNRPILSLIDTPGAYPGIGAEKRGQAYVIAKNLMEMPRIRVPMISVIIGEGGSGGALGVLGWDMVYMLENSYYSVISPEGGAAILLKNDPREDVKKVKFMANALQPTAKKALELKVIDGIIPEPKGGAHTDHYNTFVNVGNQVLAAYDVLREIPIDDLLDIRYKKLRAIGKDYEI